MSTDEEAIRGLLGKLAQLTDDGDVDERVKLYLDDGTFEMGGRRASGRDEIAAAFAATAANAQGGKHITANTVIELQEDKADVRTDWVYFRGMADGVVPAAIGRYYDKLEKKSGGWLIRERRIVPTAPG
jgi:uncharacterized protein (TIGR02246 family)